MNAALNPNDHSQPSIFTNLDQYSKATDIAPVRGCCGELSMTSRNGSFPTSRKGGLAVPFDFTMSRPVQSPPSLTYVPLQEMPTMVRLWGGLVRSISLFRVLVDPVPQGGAATDLQLGRSRGVLQQVRAHCCHLLAGFPKSTHTQYSSNQTKKKSKESIACTSNHCDPSHTSRAREAPHPRLSAGFLISILPENFNSPGHRVSPRGKKRTSYRIACFGECCFLRCSIFLNEEGRERKTRKQNFGVAKIYGSRMLGSCTRVGSTHKAVDQWHLLPSWVPNNRGPCAPGRPSDITSGVNVTVLRLLYTVPTDTERRDHDNDNDTYSTNTPFLYKWQTPSKLSQDSCCPGSAGVLQQQDSSHSRDSLRHKRAAATSSSRRQQGDCTQDDRRYKRHGKPLLEPRARRFNSPRSVEPFTPLPSEGETTISTRSSSSSGCKARDLQRSNPSP